MSLSSLALSPQGNPGPFLFEELLDVLDGDLSISLLVSQIDFSRQNICCLASYFPEADKLPSQRWIITVEKVEEKDLNQSLALFPRVVFVNNHLFNLLKIGMGSLPYANSANIRSIFSSVRFS